MSFELESFIITRDMFRDENGEILKESGIEDIIKYAYTRVNPEIRGAKEDNSDGIIRFHKDGQVVLFGIQEVKRCATRNTPLIEQLTQCLAYDVDWTDTFEHVSDRTKFLVLANEKSISILPLSEDFRESSFYNFFRFIKDNAKEQGITPCNLYKYGPMKSHMWRYRERILPAITTFPIDEENGLDFKEVVQYIINTCL